MLIYFYNHRRKSRNIVIDWSSSCKNFNIDHYSKSIIGINTKHRILAHYGKVAVERQGDITLKATDLALCPLLTKTFCSALNH